VFENHVNAIFYYAPDRCDSVRSVWQTQSY